MATHKIPGNVNKLNSSILNKLTVFVFVTCFSVGLFAQKKNSNFRIHIHKTQSPIIIDGLMNDEAWKQAASVKNFYSVLPMDTGMAKVPTEVRMCFDDKNIYILAICTKTIEGPDMVESLRRDFSFQKNDNFIFFLDPFDDQTSGFTFGANAAGAQWDGDVLLPRGPVNTAIQGETEALVKWGGDGIVLIDDIRYFGQLEGWPPVEGIRGQLLSAHPDWAFYVQDDIARAHRPF